MTLIETTMVSSPWCSYFRRIVALVRGVPVVFVSWREKPWEIYSVDSTGLEEFAGYTSPKMARRLNLYVQIEV